MKATEGTFLNDPNDLLRKLDVWLAELDYYRDDEFSDLFQQQCDSAFDDVTEIIANIAAIEAQLPSNQRDLLASLRSQYERHLLARLVK